jgi:hypothetical protein
MIASELGSGNDFAGAVKEKQGRADSQLFNTWGKFLPAQDQFISWLDPRLTGISGKGWEDSPIPGANFCPLRISSFRGWFHG